MVKQKKFNGKKDPHAAREAEKYENPIPSREFILAFLAERGRPATLEQVEDELNLSTPDEREAIRRRLIAMTRDGQLLKNRKGAYGPIDSMEVIIGRVIGHKDGFGFVVPDAGGDDLFLSPKEMCKVFHGDKVLTRVANVDTRGRREAMIVEVLEKKTNQIVGKFVKEGGVGVVEASNRRVTQDIFITPGTEKDAKEGQMVVAAITHYPTMRTHAIGEIVEVLGDHMAAGMEIEVAMRSHDLPCEWPDAALEEAQSYLAEVTDAEMKGRMDYRKMPFVTIDGEDAKDFDDAVYCVKKPKGGFTLYVAIADVSHYVKPNSALDKEAYERGNSVYFPGRVIPMLPETLSNHLCSLNPKVNRLVMVCEMSINAAGRITKHKFTEGVIYSHARLTYYQVHRMMEKNDKRVREQFKSVVPVLKDLYELFHILQTARGERGAIDFDMPETKIIYGRNRKIEKIVAYERFDSHKVIEECMLSANISTARYLEKNNHPALYRVHEGPTEEKLNDLRRFLNENALKMPGHRSPVSGDYAAVLRAAKERPDAHVIQTILLRSMSQAIYTPENKGHFGLAYDAYTHFTSPIRRYPDLLVHRAIKEVIAKKKSSLDVPALERMGEHCSMTERRADDATSEATDFLKCEFMLDKVGQAFSGRIAGVTSFGLFVELSEIYVEGLIHISNLPGDYYRFDAVKHVLRGDKSGRQFRLGDFINVVLARVNLDQREIDFVLDEMLDERPKKKAKQRVVVKIEKPVKKKKPVKAAQPVKRGKASAKPAKQAKPTKAKAAKSTKPVAKSAKPKRAKKK